MSRLLMILAALVAGAVPALSGQPLPSAVQASIDDAMKVCGKDKPVFGKGFLTRRDINGDKISDFILDYGSFSCGGNPSSYCGSGGCSTEVFASLPDGTFKRVLSDTVRGVSFKTVKGRPAMMVELHGSVCGQTGADACGQTLCWNGFTFSPAH